MDIKYTYLYVEDVFLVDELSASNSVVYHNIMVPFLANYKIDCAVIEIWVVGNTYFYQPNMEVHSQVLINSKDNSIVNIINE